MRGRTLANAFIILDEAQNTSTAQMKMFLTRFGENSRMVICGDPRQVDLPVLGASGLADAVSKLEGVDGIATIRFGASDVVPIGRAHVCTPVTNAPIVCRLLIENKTHTPHHTNLDARH